MAKKKENKIERQKVKIKDVPYMYLEFNILEGDIEEVAKNILNLRKKLKEAYDIREKDILTSYRKDMIPVFTPFKDYKYINLSFEFGYDGDRDIIIEAFRDETNEELNKRIEINKNRILAAKKATITKKLAQEKREKTLFENLKKKYDK
jgi:hypothetical protein